MFFFLSAPPPFLVAGPVKKNFFCGFPFQDYSPDYSKALGGFTRSDNANCTYDIRKPKKMSDLVEFWQIFCTTAVTTLHNTGLILLSVFQIPGFFLPCKAHCSVKYVCMTVVIKCLCLLYTQKDITTSRSISYCKDHNYLIVNTMSLGSIEWVPESSYNTYISMFIDFLIYKI